MGGTGVVSKAETAGLWVGESNGIRVCFFVSDDGTSLTSSSECDLGMSSSGDANSYGLEVESIGRDENGEPCSLSLSYELDVAIDAATGAFGATYADPGGDAELAFSGALVGLDASGVATRVEDGSTCTVGWGDAHVAKRRCRKRPTGRLRNCAAPVSLQNE